ncbi:sporulation initiation phosphotransferase F [bacterium BMS3Abin15]|nr:sporulation initiation phosphotransferase F [bacterium BMS3Abin15]HDZ85803.1 response regulator [Candidatus Moranbacteria bacterium]
MSKLILVVDDTPGVLEAVTIMLQHGGFETCTARNGADAIKILTDGLKPDLILSDSKMPGIGGLDLLKHIQDNDLGIPFVMMSSDEEAVERAMEMNAAAGLTKPLDITVLLDTVKSSM